MTGASTSDCTHQGLAVNAPDWGLAHRFLMGTAVQGTEIFQVQFDVASSTATCYYDSGLALPYWETLIEVRPSKRGLNSQGSGPC